MPSCNLAETVHHKWLMQSGNSMESVYEATVEDLIRAFMQITNYRAWLKGGQSGKGPDQATLKLRAAASSKDPKLISEAMKTFPGAEDFPIHDTPLEGSEIFGSTKRKLNMPIGSQFDSHRPDKVNYSIPRLNTRSTRQRIEESLKEIEVPDIVHTTWVLETDCDPHEWHIARIPKKSARVCQALQATTGKACKVKITDGTGEGTPAPTYVGSRKDFRRDNHFVEAEFSFCADDINRCVKGSKRAYVKDWPRVPTTWPVKIGTRLTPTEVRKLEEAGFQLQQQSQMSPRRLFMTSANLPIPRSEFQAPENHDSYPKTRFGKARRRNSDAPNSAHQNKWETARLMNGYYVTAVTTIPYPGYGAVLSIRSDKEKTYSLSISNLPQCDCEDFKNMSLRSRSPKWVPCKHFYYIFMYLCKMDIARDNFMHAPTYSYNEVMQILELASIVNAE